MNKWTIQVTYTTKDDDGKPIYARTVVWVDAETIPDAYQESRRIFEGQKMKFGAIIPGHHPPF